LIKFELLLRPKSLEGFNIFNLTFSSLCKVQADNKYLIGKNYKKFQTFWN